MENERNAYTYNVLILTSRYFLNRRVARGCVGGGRGCGGGRDLSCIMLDPPCNSVYAAKRLNKPIITIIIIMLTLYPPSPMHREKISHHRSRE